MRQGENAEPMEEAQDVAGNKGEEAVIATEATDDEVLQLAADEYPETLLASDRLRDFWRML